jgi:hypothetical protein
MTVTFQSNISDNAVQILQTATGVLPIDSTNADTIKFIPQSSLTIGGIPPISFKEITFTKGVTLAIHTPVHACKVNTQENSYIKAGPNIQVTMEFSIGDGKPMGNMKMLPGTGVTFTNQEVLYNLNATDVTPTGETPVPHDTM